jgi:hypothetical protein
VGPRQAERAAEELIPGRALKERGYDACGKACGLFPEHQYRPQLAVGDLAANAAS